MRMTSEDKAITRSPFPLSISAQSEMFTNDFASKHEYIKFVSLNFSLSR